jgi:tetratricopeptide (TPR) repeat protein
VVVGVHQLRGEFEAGDALAVRALARARSPRVRGILLQNRGAMAAQRRDFASAERLFAESMAAFREAGYELGMAIALNNASAAARDAGDPRRAVELARQATELARRLSAPDILLLAVQNQAHALVILGQPDEAEALITEAVSYFAHSNNVLRQAECLEILGMLNGLRPEYRNTAVRCFELARTLAERVGDRVLSDRLAERLASTEAPPH